MLLVLHDWWSSSCNFPLSFRRWQFEKGCVISSFWNLLLSRSSRKQGKLVFGKKHYGTTLCKSVEILHRCRWVLTSIRDLQILRYDHEYEIFSVLSSACAWTSVILAGKRGSRRHSSTSFRANVVVARTRYQKLEVLSFLLSGERVTFFTTDNSANFSSEKW